MMLAKLTGKQEYTDFLHRRAGGREEYPARMIPDFQAAHNDKQHIWRRAYKKTDKTVSQILPPGLRANNINRSPPNTAVQ